MLALKVSCTKCSHHTQCPQKTRFFVNYCGADWKKMGSHIKTAVVECRSRRGYIFKQMVVFEKIASPLLEVPPLAVPA